MKRLIGFLVMVSVLLAACESSETMPVHRLGINQSARLSSDVVVTVDSIRDGRCPMNANIDCITGGVASAYLTIRKDADSYQRQLYVGFDKNRYGYRSDSTVVSFGTLSYSLVLKDVTPYPTQIIPDKDQRALLIISRL